jgi:hypothetical protein
MAGFSPASQPIGPAESSVDEADVGKVFSYESRSYRRLAPLEEAIVNKQGEASMALSLVLHRVAGFDPWQEVYDSVTPRQTAGGVSAESVHQMGGDPDNVPVINQLDSVAAAQGFFANPDLLEAMDRAGVKAEPGIGFDD